MTNTTLKKDGLEPNNFISKLLAKELSPFLILALSLIWVLLCSIYFYYTKNPTSYVQDDLLHQVATSLNRLNPMIFSKDYLYSDPKTLGFYSPLQIWSITKLIQYGLTINLALLTLSYCYSSFFTICSWFLAKQLTKNWVIFVLIMLISSQFVSMPTNTGYSSGLLRGIFPFFFPYNSLVARGLVLLFIGLVISNRTNYLPLQCAILGLIFTFHAPTGLTLSIGCAPYFLMAIKKNKKLIFFCFAAFLITSSPFIFNYFTFKIYTHLSHEQNSLLYKFWQFRFPDDYPHPLWKLITRSDIIYSWIPHVYLFFISLLLYRSIYIKNIQLGFLGLAFLCTYLFGLKAIPLMLFIIGLAYLCRPLSMKQATYNLLLILSGTFFVCTWGQWFADLYYKYKNAPPFYIDNARFLPYLFPFLAIILVQNLIQLKHKLLLLVALLALSLPLTFNLFDSVYLNYALKENIKLRATFDSSTNFFITPSDYKNILLFTQKTSNDSLFLYQADTPSERNFRIDSKRSIAINFSDMAFKYYNKKLELSNEWDDFILIHEAYKTKNLSSLCPTLSKLKINYVIFPNLLIMDNPSCLTKELGLESASVYRVR